MARLLNNKEIHSAFGTEKDNSKDPNRKGMTAFQKKLAAIVLTGTVLVGGSGIGVSVSKSLNNAAATAEAEKQVQEEAVVSPQEAEYQRIESYSEAMEKYKNMSVAEFEHLPRDERLAYSQYLIDLTVANGNYKLVYGLDNAKQYAVVPVKASANNTDKEIRDIITFNNQAAFLQPADGNAFNDPFNLSDGEKALSSTYYQTEMDELHPTNYIGDKTTQEGLDYAVYLEHKYTVLTDTSENVNGIDRDGDEVTSRVSNYRTNVGTTFYERDVLTTFKNYDGKAKQIWQFDVREQKLEELDPII